MTNNKKIIGINTCAGSDQPPMPCVGKGEEEEAEAAAAEELHNPEPRGGTLWKP